MGIPYYFRSLVAKHKRLVRLAPAEAVDVFCLDFNCAIHHFLRQDSGNPIQNVVDGLRLILQQFTRPPTTIYCAIDGVVPMAKQIQQRNRRFVSAGSSLVPSGTSPEGVSGGGSTLPPNPQCEGGGAVSPPFDRNQISPCTPFMQELEAALRAAFPEMLLSPSSEPGEGEHKIMTYLSAHHKGQRACIYGLDADLILLSLQDVSLYTSLQLLREHQEFGGRAGDADAGPQRYALLDIGGLADTMKAEGAPDPSAYVDLCNVFGNDFLPPLACFGLRTGGHDRLLASTKTKPRTVEELLRTVSASEPKLLQEAQEHFHRNAGRGGGVASDDPEALPRAFSQRVDGIRFGQPGWRFRYYQAALGSSTESDIATMCQAYWKTLQWVRAYYRDHVSCPSWSWYYPYAGAPLVIDLLKYPIDSAEIQWKCVGIPDVKQQLSYILPRSSWRVCGLEPDAAPAECSVKLRGHAGYIFKRFLWECKPLWG